MENKKINHEQAFQTMIVLWAALLASQILFLFMAFIVKPELFKFDFSQPLLGQDAIIPGVFALLALTAVAASFYLRKQEVEKAIAEQKVERVQTGLIIGCALSEVSSLFGLFLAFAYEYQYFFAWIALGIIATLLHIPKRSDVAAASFKG